MVYFMGRQQKTLDEMKIRVKKFNNNFEEYLAYFNKNNIFTGPSIYFHIESIKFLRQNDLSVVLEKKLFYEYLYATLASWGLHRMGDTKTKLVNFVKFRDSIYSQKEKILDIKDEKITELSQDNFITNRLQEIIGNLKIGEGDTKIVYNSKALHHLLPDLMPPIDRQYTLQFFYHSTNPSNIDNCFSEIYPYFISIANSNKKIIHKNIGNGFNTSKTKVIDNAIVGYVKGGAV